MKFFAIIAAAQLAAALPLAKETEDTKACSGSDRMLHHAITSISFADQIQLPASSKVLPQGFQRSLE